MDNVVWTVRKDVPLADLEMVLNDLEKAGNYVHTVMPSSGGRFIVLAYRYLDGAP